MWRGKFFTINFCDKILTNGPKQIQRLKFSRFSENITFYFSYDGVT